MGHVRTVVGSSPAILGSGLGRRIDLHDAIFRVNAAVTSRRFRGSVTDLRADVGSRSTVRVWGSLPLPELSRFSERLYIYCPPVARVSEC